MANPTAADVLGRVLLVTGNEEFLAERTVAQARSAVRSYDAEAEVSDVAATSLGGGELGELTAPSLFSATRCVVVLGLEDLPDEAKEPLVAYAQAPADDVALVLVHGGGQKGQGVLTALRKVDAVREVKTVAPKTRELGSFVASEVRASGGRIEPDAADVLVDAVGHDLRSLAAAAAQLVHDFPGERIAADRVRRYFAGRAEASSFAVADAAIEGRTAAALEELRWALDGGVAPVLVTSAFATGLRALAKFSEAPRGLREADLSREVGVPPWKIRTLRQQVRGWAPGGLAAAIRLTAAADAAVKGAATDAAYALERLVLDVAGARTPR